MKSQLKQYLGPLVRRIGASKSVCEGLAAFKSIGQTPAESYQSLITLHPQARTGLPECVAQFPRLYSKHDVTP